MYILTETYTEQIYSGRDISLLYVVIDINVHYLCNLIYTHDDLNTPVFYSMLTKQN